MSEQKSTAKNKTVHSFCEYCSKELNGSWAFTFSKIENGVITDSAVSQKICAECALDLKTQVEDITNEIKSDLNNTVSNGQLSPSVKDQDDEAQQEIEQNNHDQNGSDPVSLVKKEHENIDADQEPGQSIISNENNGSVQTEPAGNIGSDKPEPGKNIHSEAALRGPEPIEKHFDKPRGYDAQKLSDKERKKISDSRIIAGRRDYDNKPAASDPRTARQEQTVKNASDPVVKKQAEIETLEQWLIKVKDQGDIIKVFTSFNRSFEGAVIAADHKGMIISTPDEQLFLPYSEIRYISISNP